MDVVFVVVVYRIGIDQSSTLQTLLSSLEQVSGFSYHILVFDNSEDSASRSATSVQNGTLISCGSNRGLAAAYNDALSYCCERGVSVLVTLDQDSIVTIGYLQALVAGMKELDDRIVVICPRVISHGRLISPYKVDWLGRTQFGLSGQHVVAINAFSAYSVRFLRSLGGFEEFYWLDALDLSTYARLACCGKSVGLLGVSVEHELEALSGRVSRFRMTNIAYYGACYLFQYQGLLQVLVGLLRLFVRAVRVAPRRGWMMFVAASLGSIMRGSVAGVTRRWRDWREEAS